MSMQYLCVYACVLLYRAYIVSYILFIVYRAGEINNHIILWYPQKANFAQYIKLS